MLKGKKFPKNSEIFYLVVKYLKYTLYAVSASWLGSMPIFALVPAILLQLGEIIYILSFPIYNTKTFIAFRIIENLGFFFIALLMLVLYAISNFAEQELYFHIGSVIYAIMIGVVAIATIRAICIFYTIIRSQSERT